MKPATVVELLSRLALGVAVPLLRGDTKVLTKRVGDILPKKLQSRIKLDALKAKGRAR